MMIIKFRIRKHVNIVLQLTCVTAFFWLSISQAGHGQLVKLFITPDHTIYFWIKFSLLSFINSAQTLVFQTVTMLHRAHFSHIPSD